MRVDSMKRTQPGSASEPWHDERMIAFGCHPFFDIQDGIASETVNLAVKFNWRATSHGEELLRASWRAERSTDFS